MAATPYLTLRSRIVRCNDGNVYLTEDMGKLWILPAKETLPSNHSTPCPYHANPHFSSAQSAGRPAAVFRSYSGNMLVVPIKPYASIADFAKRASIVEFASFFSFVYQTRKRLAAEMGVPLFIETIGHDVPHFHVRLVSTRVHQPSRTHCDVWTPPHNLR
jgi:hypothetical protein